MKNVILTMLMVFGASAQAENLIVKITLSENTQQWEYDAIESLGSPQMLENLLYLYEQGKVVTVQFERKFSLPKLSLDAYRHTRESLDNPGVKEPAKSKASSSESKKDDRECMVTVKERDVSVKSDGFATLEQGRTITREREYTYKGPCDWVDRNVAEHRERLEKEQEERERRENRP